mgnify:CR=1 FL=1
MGFGLSSPECDLLVLAGLPDEHEGIATTLRSMHPQSEPRPTVGLAALLLGETFELRSVVAAAVIIFAVALIRARGFKPCALA